MEWKPYRAGLHVPDAAAPLKPSLVEWKQVGQLSRREQSIDLETFLGGMETNAQGGRLMSIFTP